MKTARERDIATSILQAGNFINQAGINVQPEAEYGVDGRRCDARFESDGSEVFMEIFGGTNLSYMRDRMLMRDSRIFNRRLGKKNKEILHLICNDQAYRAMTEGPACLVEARLVSISEELDHYVNHHVVTLPAEPTKKAYREVAKLVSELLCN